MHVACIDCSRYVTLRGATPGKPSTTPAWRRVSRNLLVNAGEWALDHDDGSRYFVDDSNVLIYGGAKQGYHGYALNASNNLFLRPDLGCGNTWCVENDGSGVSSPKRQGNFFVNNTCIVSSDNATVAGYANLREFEGTTTPGDDSDSSDKCHYDPDSSTTTQPIANTILTPDGTIHSGMLPCGAETMAEWQALGFDRGGRVGATPPVREIMRHARVLLGVSP